MKSRTLSALAAWAAENAISRFGEVSGRAILRTLLVLLVIPSIWGQSNRLPGWINDSIRITLPGSVHPLAKPEFDRGAVAPDFHLESIVIGLKKTVRQQADLNQLLTDLQDLKSPLYHHWLTPEEFADRFGVSQTDIDKITAWLKSSGFEVQNVARGRDMIMFSGTAALVELVLRTPIHHFNENGEEHYAAAAAPSIPKELADLVTGIRGLDDFKPRPSVRRRWNGTPTLTLDNPKQQFQDGNGNNLLAPADLAIIYGLNPLYQEGIDGTSQVIAIAGGSDIDMSDIAAFRQIFGLHFSDPTKLLVPGSTNPGQNPAMEEADLDLEWAGAIAPGAHLVYVFSGDPFASALYAIDQTVAPILSTSFGICEWHFIPDDFNLFHAYSQRAAAEGITWVSASGDSGAAGCEDQNGIWTFATTRMSVLMPAALPEVTAVGGTEFNEGQGYYWSTQIGPNGGTALSYIPETAWNNELLILQNLGLGVLDTEGFGFAAGGGGSSIYWNKPQWQAGPGVPNDGFRDVPDVSLAASPFHDPYLLATSGQGLPTGGTSASTPVFAGILALLNQYLVSTGAQSRPGLGNINPMLYFLGQNTPSVYHDITTGSNVVPCVPGSSQDCGSNGVYGYSAGPGYDLATGWGSVDAAMFISTWVNVVSKLTP